ncbi:MAG: hypothetical protein HY241_01950 [Actinobacteria bacterium]|nr:hypothetical protein [Actinomycetota bacterium]
MVFGALPAFVGHLGWEAELVGGLQQGVPVEAGERDQHRIAGVEGAPVVGEARGEVIEFHAQVPRPSTHRLAGAGVDVGAGLGSVGVLAPATGGVAGGTVDEPPPEVTALGVDRFQAS